MYKYQMKICHQSPRIITSFDSLEQNQGNPKFSLRDRCYREKNHKLDCSRASNPDFFLNSRLQEFLSQHNSRLIVNKNTKEVNPKKRGGFLNCFEGANNVLQTEKDLLPSQFSRRCASSTVSSSNYSEVGSQRQHSNNISSSAAAFKINTQSIIKQLVSQQRAREVQEGSSSKKNQYFQGGLDFCVLNKLGESKCSYKSSSYKSSKVSVRNEGTREKAVNSKTGRESINYKQLQENYQLGNVLKPQFFDSSFSLQSSRSIVNIQSNAIERRQRIKAENSGQCRCSSHCRWIAKWMKIVNFSKVLQRQTAPSRSLIQIEKDIPRTQISRYRPDVSNFNQQLRDILTNFAALRPSIGYTQGMNFIASAILTHTRQIGQAMPIFDYIMVQRKYQLIYEGNLTLVEKLSIHVAEQLKRYSHDFSDYLDENGVDLSIFVRSWYFSMLGSFVPLQSVACIIDKFIRKGFKGLNQVIVTLLIYLKQQFLLTNPEDLVTKFTNSWLMERSKLIDWSELVSCSENIMVNDLQL